MVEAHAASTFLQGSNPLHDPFALFLVQIVVIIAFTRFIGFFLAFINQPRVIAEVLGGIILGQSALGRIPAFQNNLFPPESLSGLNMVANLGLVLFLFLVGLELDFGSMITNGRQATLISVAGIIFPFAFSTLASKVLYDTLMVGTTTPFGTFLFFNGVAMSITAFPVLARILSERKLITTEVGLITISAAAANDVVAWILLLIIVASISFFTQAVGVHAIFGAFLVGLMVPHDFGFAIKIAEKIEDIVSIVLLPLYFAYSGLNTRIDQLDSGIAWANVALVIFCACAGKIIGSFIACKVSGLPNRESLSVGVLMNTKGLVELIVLNIGLSAHVINESVFTVMVVMALATTFMTVPLITLTYPRSLHKFVGGPLTAPSHLSIESQDKKKLKIFLALRNMQSVRPMMSLLQMAPAGETNIELTAFRILPLGDRIGSLMKAQEASETLRADPVLEVFKTFAQLNHIPIDTMLSIAPQSEFAFNTIQAADESNVNLIIVSHRLPKFSRNEDSKIKLFFDDKYSNAALSRAIFAGAVNTTVAVFMDRGFNVGLDEQNFNIQDTVRSINSIRMRSVASPVLAKVFVPFYGGADDREAIIFCLHFYKGVDIKFLIMSSTKSHRALDLQESQAVLEKSETLEHVSIPAGEVNEDSEILETLRNHIDTLTNSQKFDEGSMVIEEVECEESERQFKTLSWLKDAALGSSDLVILGRALYEKARVNNTDASKFELEIPSSFFVIQHSSKAIEKGGNIATGNKVEKKN
ncbi:K(+)/H(+) antiporter [Clydaea vesicula]|uniref:K(+)/H(+) antiporter n=1 Tax=Clydaea vesicula TaxID=447962 RepID=A0AAD5UAW5_9FUNG|nr:K(+)/H(+) antiporter [Clydaea vesicula]